MSKTLHPGELMPELEIARLGGGVIKVGGKGRWQLLVVYRGKHCPICKTYLLALEALKEEFAKLDTEVAAVSADPQEKAAAHMEDLKLSMPVGYGLTLAQMRTLGLYISNPRDANETDRPFAEPGLFVVNPDGLLQAVDRSNAPWLRPDLAMVADTRNGELGSGRAIAASAGAPGCHCQEWSIGPRRGASPAWPRDLPSAFPLPGSFRVQVTIRARSNHGARQALQDRARHHAVRH